MHQNPKLSTVKIALSKNILQREKESLKPQKGLCLKIFLFFIKSPVFFPGGEKNHFQTSFMNNRQNALQVGIKHSQTHVPTTFSALWISAKC